MINKDLIIMQKPDGKEFASIVLFNRYGRRRTHRFLATYYFTGIMVAELMKRGNIVDLGPTPGFTTYASEDDENPVGLEVTDELPWGHDCDTRYLFKNETWQHISWAGSFWVFEQL
jgi:hypothetical protein